MLSVQEKERQTSSTITKCLFCKIELERSCIFKHMYGRHAFNVGFSENLVHVSEMLSHLTTKLDSNACLFCEKIFKNPLVLKEHMRKKKHLKINPKNHEYDRFYIINYVEPGRNWKDRELTQVDEDETVDWDADDDGEEVLNEPTMCLFDDHVFDNVEDTYKHMKESHKFDLKGIKKDMSNL